MADGLHEYAFDVTLLSVRLKAKSLQDAKDKLIEALDCATIHFSEQHCLVMREPTLIEFDGEPASEANNGEIRIGD